jgi:hypothetical protein
VDVYWTSSTSVTLDLYQYGGSSTLLATATWSPFSTELDWDLKVCLADGHFMARLGTNDLVGFVWETVGVADLNPGHVGLGYQGSGSESALVDYDDFQVETTQCDDICNQVCRDCFASCEGHYLPKTLTLSIVGSIACTGHSDEFPIVWSDSLRVWQDPGAYPYTVCGENYAEPIYLRPTEDDGCLEAKTSWQLYGPGLSSGEMQSDSTCDPLYLHYRVELLNDGPQMCCDNLVPYGPRGQLDFYVTE